MTENLARRILALGADPERSRLIQKSLQKHGYAVDTAANGREGLAMVERTLYDLVLLDDEMPVSSGLDVIRTLAERDRPVPTVMIASEDGIGAAVAALKVGSADYVVRDREMQYLELLRVVIGRVLDRQRMLSEKQQMFQVVQESEERYRYLFEMNPLPMWVVDSATGAFLEVNRAAGEHYGYTRAEFLRLLRGMVELPDPDDGAGSAASRRPSARRHRKRSGEVIEVETVSHAVNYGGIRAEVVLCHDVTERKRIEEEQIRSQKLEALGTLAGGLAHDLNNILTAILGNVSLAKVDILSGREITGRLDQTEKASLRARDLANQLITFSRGGAPVLRTIGLRELIRQAADAALRGTRSRAAYLIAEDLAPVHADEGQIRQVISNLVLNADQAMPEGGTVRIRAENTLLGPDAAAGLGAGSYIRVSVSDQGTGVPSGIRERIFDPYFTTKEKANGLGLATSYAILRRHNGLISLETSTGAGATFSVLLPAAAVAPGTDLAAAATEPVPAGSGRILIMDDEPLVREVAGLMLSNSGYEVGLARDGDEAIAMYEQAMKAGRRYDAVIMDLTVPGGMGGREVVKHLRDIDPAVRGIVSSGYSSDPIMSEYARYGFCAVIPKPYTLPLLTKAVEDVLKL